MLVLKRVVFQSENIKKENTNKNIKLREISLSEYVIARYQLTFADIARKSIVCFRKYLCNGNITGIRGLRIKLLRPPCLKSICNDVTTYSV